MHGPTNKKVQEVLAKLQTRLDPDPAKALLAFEDLLLSVVSENDAIKSGSER